MAIKVYNGNPIEDDMCCFEIVNLGDKERQLFGFQWTFDDANAGEFDYLDPGFPGGRSKNHARGYATGHCWDTPGTKHVQCVVIHRLEDGATRTKTLTVEVTVRDKEAVFPVTDRWVVGAVAGDTVPAGTVINTIDEGIAAIRSNNGGWLQIRGGKTYSLTSISDPRSGEGLSLIHI